MIVKTVTPSKKFYLSLKAFKARKKADTNFVLLCQSRNIVGQFK